jgi:hypothetical protein
MMTPNDPMAVAIGWLDAYRSARLDQMVAMYSPDAVIDCACGACGPISGVEDISAYWRQRFVETPALELDLQAEGEAIVIIYRTTSAIVETLLDIADDGLITCCACGLERRLDC